MPRQPVGLNIDETRLLEDVGFEEAAADAEVAPSIDEVEVGGPLELAKELEQRGSLMLLGAGPKSNQPLILRRGGTPYRGFLEGRTEGEKYCLMLHFSNLELKLPKSTDQPS